MLTSRSSQFHVLLWLKAVWYSHAGFMKVSQEKRDLSLAEVTSFHGSFVAGKPDPAMLVSQFRRIVQSTAPD